MSTFMQDGHSSTTAARPLAHAAPATPADDTLPAPSAEANRVRLVIGVGVALLLAAAVFLYFRSESRSNHVAPRSLPKAVGVIKAESASYRAQRSYVGTLDAWNSARVGPQYVAAYVSTVLVRPGALVRQGQVLGTLDCKNESAEAKEIAARAKAVEERQAAAQDEAERMKELKQGGYASPDEVEQLAARSASQMAEAESLRASLVTRGLAVDDCILRAPFTGEVSDRFVDPGAFVRPGDPVVTIVDRTTVRIAADAPESDFAVVATGTDVAIDVEATGTRTDAKISRRAPTADPDTRTVHFEIDVPNPTRALPAGATARLAIDVGAPRPSSRVPLAAATLRGEKASVFTVENGVAHRVVVPVLGEREGELYLDSKLAPGTPVVVEGRALLDDGDAVKATELTQ